MEDVHEHNLDKGTSALVLKWHGHDDSETSQTKRTRMDSHCESANPHKSPIDMYQSERIGTFAVYLIT